MAKVTVLPAKIEFEGTAGETIMGAAQAHGYYWPTTCSGQGVCTTCLSEVISGSELLAGMSRSERKTLVAERGGGVLRLARGPPAPPAPALPGRYSPQRRDHGEQAGRPRCRILTQTRRTKRTGRMNSRLL